MDREFTDRLLETVRPDPANGPGEPQAVLHAAYDAIIQGDFEAFAELVADDVELNIHGSGPMDGSWRGRSEVVAAARRNFALVSAQQPQVESMLSQGNCVAVLLRESGVFKSTGQAYRLRGVQWFTFADGKIKRIDEIAATSS
jgi:hypothetical protein